MLKLAWRSAAAHWSRFALTGLAVVLSVAFLTSTLILTDSVSGTAAQDLPAAFSDVDAVVSGREFRADDGPNDSFTRQSLPAGTLDVVTTTPGVSEAAPVVSGFAKLIRNGEVLGAEIYADAGQNWIDSELNAFDLIDGSAPVLADEVVIDRRAASDFGLGVGDEVQVLTTTGTWDVTVSGIASFGGGDGDPNNQTTLFAPAYAAEILDGAVTQVYVGFESSTDEAAANATLAALAEALPGVEVTSGDVYVDDQLQLLEALSTFITIFLLSFAVIAMLVGVTIIYNTFAIAFSQRRREFALLRAVGAERCQVMRSVMGESALVGVGATAVGLVAGYFGVGLLRWIMKVLGLDFLSGTLVISASSLVIAAVTGVVVTLISAFFPALSATSVAPVEALRDAVTEQKNIPAMRLTIGGICLAIGAISVIAAATAESAWLLLGVGLVVPGLALSGPLLMGAVARLARPVVASWADIEGSMAATNLRRNRRRAASTSLALSLGVTLIGFFTIMANSLAATVTNDLDSSIKGNYVVSSLTDEASTIDKSLVSHLAAIDGVNAAGALAQAPARVNGQGRFVAGIDAASFSEVFDLGVTEGSLDGLASGGAAILAGETPEELQIGDELTMEFSGGTVQAPIVAVVSTGVGTFDPAPYFIDSELLEQTQTQSSLLHQSIYLSVEDRAVDTVRTAINASPGALLQTKEDFLASTGTEIDSFRNLVYAMLGLTVVIALVGIANTTMLAINERTREIGLLRAVGTTRSGVRRIIRIEAALVATVGALVGLVVSVFGGWGLFSAVAFTPDIVVPWLSLSLIAVGGMIAGVLVAAYPSWRASRLPMLEAITFD